MVAIREVARRTGVSVATVSRVINGSPLVNEAMRQRVLQAMAELDYTPSAPARSLKGGRSRLLGIVVHTTANPFFSSIIRGIEDVAYAAGYCAITCSFEPGPERLRHYLRILREHRVTGIVIVPHDLRAAGLAAIVQAGTPVVSVDNRLHGIDSVLLDNAGAAAQAVDHLLRLGHRRVGIVTGPLRTTTGRGRLIGYRRALRRAGVALERDLQAVSEFNEYDAARLMQAMLSRPDRPSAVVAATNHLALGTLAAAAAVGLRIPQDLALVGFDEHGWTPTLVSPLTTVAQPTYEMGAVACRLLLDRLAARETGPARRVYLPAHLIVRYSCGAPSQAREQESHLLRLAFVGQHVAQPAHTAAPLDHERVDDGKEVMRTDPPEHPSTRASIALASRAP